ncbi:uncharacterized protein LOC130046339 [Ostrea edulis]|uniref:uncharacterized protein LOC130046339 n=1 Tax=Ostrea edulis TaxID=37623 RepID=UPI0024AFDBBC|nr:uncharacterized protein LOC130046339 [Ostrea edulis]
MNLRLDNEKFQVSLRGKGGLCLRHIRFNAKILHFDTTPDICFMHIGENDISPRSEPGKISEDIFSQTCYLRDGVGVKQVIVCQLLRRLPYASCPRFNEMVQSVNHLLKEKLSDVQGIVFWPHRGFWESLSYICPDGVHLLCTQANDQSMRKFLWSISNAIIINAKYLSKHAKGQSHFKEATSFTPARSKEVQSSQCSTTQPVCGTRACRVDTHHRL